MVIQLSRRNQSVNSTGVGWAGFSLLDLVEKVDRLCDVGCKARVGAGNSRNGRCAVC
jgi:hypothetical protein